MNFSKLASLATVITVISGITFSTITAFDSEDSNIKAAITKLKNAALNYKGKYEQAQKNYEDTLRDLGNTQQSLEAAKQKLMDIYKALTGQDWNTEEDILAFDFDTIIPENNFSNNVDGDAIAAQLGLEAGATTQEILSAIIDLQNQVASLSEQVTNLTNQVQQYATEAEELKAQLEAEQTRLEQERTALDNLMKQINKEDDEQLALANQALADLGEQGIVTEEQLQAAADNLRETVGAAGMGIGADNLINGTAEFRLSGDNIMYYNNGSGSSIGKMSNEKQAAAYNAWVEYNNLLTAYNAQQ